MFPIRTERLDLVAATVAHLEAELASPASLSSLLAASVPAGWPPGEYDRPAIEFFHRRLGEDPGAVGWYSWYAVRRPADGEPATVVGAGGYFGPPGDDGTVEIGYSVVAGFRRRGFAAELVRALVSRALATPGVTRVIAHTHPDNCASVKVLERCGFSLVGPGEEPGTVQFACVDGTS